LFASTGTLAEICCGIGMFGRTFSQPALIIAAKALRHGLTVVTRDNGDFKLARVALLNPWVGTSS
jgi:predicted nucleic acid-binding protein